MLFSPIPTLRTILFLAVTFIVAAGYCQTEPATKPTTAAAAPFAAELENAAFAAVYESSKEVNVSLNIKNNKDKPLKVVAIWQLRKLPYGETTTGEIFLDVKPKETAKARLPFPADAGYGLYEYKATILNGSHEVTSEARAAVMRTPPKDREMDRLGFNVHVANDEVAQFSRRLGLRWVRVDWHWWLCEPNKGAIAWDFMDKQVDIADKYGLKLFPIFGAGSAPAWAQLKDDTFDPKQHADYVRRVLERYKGKIPAINIWNEPDPSVIKHPRLWVNDARAIQKVARAIDPKCKVVGLGMCAFAGDPGHWHSPILKPPFSAGRYLDAYDWHPYPAPRNRRPEEKNDTCNSVDSLKKAAPKIRALVAGKELWVSELGFSTCGPITTTTINLNGVVKKIDATSSSLYPYNVTEKQQGDYLVRQTMLEFGYGVDKMFLFHLCADGEAMDDVEAQFGIMRTRSNGLSPKIAYVQIGNMVQELAGATPVGVEIPSSNIRVVRFKRGDKDVVAAWAVKRVEYMNFDIVDGYQSDPFGNRRPRQGKVTVKLTESPIFMVSKSIEYSMPFKKGK